ncbi:MAG TPA: 3-phosphoshikimate 1-carboxyvinyltransferase [Streptosporangiaceae bacterium]|nr:3-phosphoshikimate 1-carboxyvinyltransferase [Streptosporangiaceae bacterium]
MHPDNNQDRTWASPAATGPVSARVQLPASKSITNRALVLAALSDGPSVIANPLRARDTALAAGALRALGSEITEYQTGWRVTPGHPAPGSAVSVDLGNAGTVMRFVPGLAALTSARVTFDGDERIRLRPIGPILEALRQVGVSIDDDGRGAAPFTVHGRGSVRGGRVVVDASGSSQLVSGLLLAAPRFGEGIEVRHEGPPVPSAPHIAMTVRMLQAAGASVDVDAGSGRPEAWRVRPGRLDLGSVTVEPDLSNAGPFLAAALVTGGSVTIQDWPQDSLQAAGPILEVLGQMGARSSVGPEGLVISGTGRVRGVNADLRDVNELAPVLAAAATMADSPSVFTGLAHTRTHETDRLAAMAKEINSLGGDVTELPDGLEIRPKPLHASEPFGTYDDHRLVMAAAVLGLAVPGLRVAGAGTVAKTFPDFAATWTAMLGQRP